MLRVFWMGIWWDFHGFGGTQALDNPNISSWTVQEAGPL